MAHVDDQLSETIVFMNYGVLCQILCVLGTVTNIINLIVFGRQGFQDTVNISLFGLAVSDLCSLITLLWQGLCFIPAFRDSDVPMMTTEVQFLTGDWPHWCFIRISGWITALIMFERCLCITVPLKVKTILTPKRVKISLFFIFIGNIVTLAPVYISNRLAWKYVESRNRTVFGLVYHHEFALLEEIFKWFYTAFSTPAPFFIVIICTILLLVKLKQTVKWRQSTTRQGSSGSNEVSGKDLRVMKMMTTIATVFVLCLTPTFLIVLWMTLEPEFVTMGDYENLFNILVSTAYMLEAINSSINIIVYLRMSTKYRQTFLALFGKGEETT